LNRSGKHPPAKGSEETRKTAAMLLNQREFGKSAGCYEMVSHPAAGGYPPAAG